MKTLFAILLVAMSLILAGCANLFSDSLHARYESGEISKEDYESLCKEREETMARDDAAHWELQQTFSENRAKLGSQ